MTTKKTFSSARKFDINSLKTKMKESAAGKKSYGNDKYWNITRDASGEGNAIIRFLPGKEGDYELPYVKLFSHSFEGPGGWLIENCPTTLGQDCPICEVNRILYKGTDEDKKVAGTRKRKTSYIANVYIVSDPANPENEGKVFLFRFGAKIFEKLMDAMSPEDPDDVSVNPFALDATGANFKLKVREVAGYPNYDKSGFAAPKELQLSEEDLQAALDSQHLLAEIVSPANFKSYADLKVKMDKVLKNSVTSTLEDSISQTSSKVVESDDDTPPWGEKETSSVSDDPDLDSLKSLIEEA